MREGNLRGTFTLTCEQCGRESPTYRPSNGGIRACIRDGWTYAMETFTVPVGWDWCPQCAKVLLQ